MSNTIQLIGYTKDGKPARLAKDVVAFYDASRYFRVLLNPNGICALVQTKKNNQAELKHINGRYTGHFGEHHVQLHMQKTKGTLVY